MNTGNWRAPFYVLLLSVTLLMIGVGRAPRMFDESHYVQAARDFLAGVPTSNPEHPPLAKYFIAASIKIFGDRPFGWRFPSVLAGGLAAMAIFGITRQLTQNTRTATIAWLLTVAGGFWFVMSRVAMLSIYQLSFELAGVWVFLLAGEKSRLPMFAFSGALFGLAAGCRWCGLVGLIACLLVAMVERERLKTSFALLATCLGTYILVWLPLLIRERRPLAGILAANEYIFHFHKYLKDDPRFSEPWWSWILRLEPKPSLGYLLANPIIGVLGLFAVAALLVYRLRGDKSKSYILFLLYIGHLAQWAIGLRTLTYYYYYLESYVVLAPALAIAMQGLRWRTIRADVVVTALSLLFFAYWYPTWSDLTGTWSVLMGAH